MSHEGTLGTLRTYLECQIAPLHLQICADVLVNRPGEFVVQFPRNDRHQHRDQPNDTRNSNEKWLFLVPNGCIDEILGARAKLFNGFIDLILLYRGVDQKTNVIDAKPDDLNCILQTKSVIDQQQLV